MRSRQLVTILLVALVVSSGLTLAKARGQPDLSVYAPDNEVSPGEDVEFSLTLQNAGDVDYATSAAEEARVTTARDVRVTLEADDAPVEVETGTQPVGNVPEGVSPSVPFSISVDDDAEPGEYTLPVRIEYKYTNIIGSSDGAYNERSRTVRRSVDLVIEDDARFRIVNAVADDLYGTNGPISLTIENVGSGTAQDANVAVRSGSGELTFGGAESTSTYVGDWAPGETREVSVRGNLAQGADRRTYPITATVSYENDDGEARESDTLSTGISPRIESRFELQDVESSLRVGEEGTVAGTVVNRGGSVARDAVLVMSADTRNLEPTETEFAVGDLPAGGAASFDYEVEISEAAASGPRQLSFTLRYRDENNEVVESDSLDARVDVAPDRDVFGVDASGATLLTGESGRIEIEVTNQGDDPVSDISAKLFANAPLSTSDDEAFIDRLDPGDTQTIVFGVSASGAALEKTYPVSIDFQYDEADGDTLLSDTYQVPVQVRAPADGDDGPPVLLIGGVVIVLAAAVFLLYRRRSS